MSEKSFNKIRLELRASRLLLVVLVAVHGGALAIAMWVPLPLALRLGLVVLIVVSAYRELNRHALRRAQGAIVAFELSAEDGACAVRRRGSTDWQEARLVEQWVHPRLTLLTVRYARKRWPAGVVIAADAVEKEAFRRLRTQLRLRKEEG